MPLPGEGFIALWNDIAPRRKDYNAWHTIEHVPERMTVDGFLRAYRYVLTEGDLPTYFTVYALRDLAALDSAAYHQLVDFPTPWSRGMRPDMRNFIRRICRTSMSRGGGVGGFAAVSLLTAQDAEGVEALAAQLLKQDGVSSVTVGQIDGGPAPFNAEVQRGALPFEPGGVLLVEGYDEQRLRDSCTAVTRADDRAAQSWSMYKLAFELRKEDLEELAFPRPSELDLAAVAGPAPTEADARSSDG